VRLLLKKQHPGSRQPHSATILKRWRGEESPSVLRRRGCQQLGKITSRGAGIISLRKSRI
ncbi:MAG: hypothetical protein EWV84_06490, partial [Microcystis sp. M_QC_C_20170808_M3Col]